MGEPAATATPNDLKDPQEKQAVRENHDADLRPDDHTLPTLTENNRSRSSTDVESEPENPDVEKADDGAPAVPDQHTDPNLVDWDGPDDPEIPTNWADRRKYAIIAVISSITFLTYDLSTCAFFRPSLTQARPLASSMFAPGIPQLMEEFHSDNVELASFVVSVFLLGFAFGPMVIAPMSEEYGRLPVYHVCNIGFVIFTIACAVSSNLNMLIAWRFFEGVFGSAPLTIGGGTIADIVVQEKRGGFMAIWAMGPLMGPVIGPVAGGFLSQAKGWRWVFWLITILVHPPFIVIVQSPTDQLGRPV